MFSFVKKGFSKIFGSKKKNNPIIVSNNEKLYMSSDDFHSEVLRSNKNTSIDSSFDVYSTNNDIFFNSSIASTNNVDKNSKNKSRFILRQSMSEYATSPIVVDTQKNLATPAFAIYNPSTKIAKKHNEEHINSSLLEDYELLKDYEILEFDEEKFVLKNQQNNKFTKQLNLTDSLYGSAHVNKGDVIKDDTLFQRLANAEQLAHGQSSNMAKDKEEIELPVGSTTQKEKYDTIRLETGNTDLIVNVEIPKVVNENVTIKITTQGTQSLQGAIRDIENTPGAKSFYESRDSILKQINKIFGGLKHIRGVKKIKIEMGSHSLGGGDIQRLFTEIYKAKAQNLYETQPQFNTQNVFKFAKKKKAKDVMKELYNADPIPYESRSNFDMVENVTSTVFNSVGVRKKTAKDCDSALKYLKYFSQNYQMPKLFYAYAGGDVVQQTGEKNLNPSYKLAKVFVAKINEHNDKKNLEGSKLIKFLKNAFGAIGAHTDMPFELEQKARKLRLQIISGEKDINTLTKEEKALFDYRFSCKVYSNQDYAQRQIANMHLNKKSKILNNSLVKRFVKPALHKLLNFFAGGDKTIHVSKEKTGFDVPEETFEDYIIISDMHKIDALRDEEAQMSNHQMQHSSSTDICNALSQTLNNIALQEEAANKEEDGEGEHSRRSVEYSQNLMRTVYPESFFGPTTPPQHMLSTIYPKSYFFDVEEGKEKVEYPGEKDDKSEKQSMHFMYNKGINNSNSFNMHKVNPEILAKNTSKVELESSKLHSSCKNECYKNNEENSQKQQKFAENRDFRLPRFVSVK